MTKDEFCELFEIQTRGAMATAFVYGKVSPGEYWPALRGEREMTLRDMGEIGHITGYNLNLQLSDNKHLDAGSDATRKEAPDAGN